jgi:PD-(D/E)XK nuclease superfamily
MSTIENGVIKQLSVSQIETFTHTSKGGCGLKFWFERVHDLRPDQTKAQSDGEAGHALLATYFETGELPKGRVKMGKAVTGTIVKGELPKPGADLLIEHRFSEQEKFDVNGQWIPLDVSNTLHIAGVPLEGFIDLAFRRGPVPEVWDHKFSSDPREYALKSKDLIRTVQMPVYVASQMPYWPDAKQWRIAHHNVSKKGVDSFIRADVVSVDQVAERMAAIAKTVEEMKLVAPVESQRDVPFNKQSCEAFGKSCPHAAICSRYKEKRPMSLSPDEADAFDFLESTAPVAHEPAPAVPERKRMPIVDVPPEPAATPPVAAAKVRKNLIEAPIVVAQEQIPDSPKCKQCLAPLDSSNASQLRSGEWVHIGCAVAAVSVLPPDAPASKPELASEQPEVPAQADMLTPAPKPRKPRAPKVELAPAPEPLAPPVADIHLAPTSRSPVVDVPAADRPDLSGAHWLPPVAPTLAPASRTETLAKLFEAIAAHLRSA